MIFDLINLGANIYGNQRQKQLTKLQGANQQLSSNIMSDIYKKQVMPLTQDQFDRRRDLSDRYLDQLSSGIAEQKDLMGNQLTMYQNLSQQGMPEEEKRMLMDAANQAAANSVAQAGSARGSLLGAMNANQSLADTYRQIASESARIRQQNMMQYAQAQGDYAQGIGALNQQEALANMQVGMGMEDYYTQAFINPQEEMMSTMFGGAQANQDSYWTGRQNQLQGNVQSVGNFANSMNQKIEQLLSLASKV